MKLHYQLAKMTSHTLHCTQHNGFSRTVCAGLVASALTFAWSVPVFAAEDNSVSSLDTVTVLGSRAKGRTVFDNSVPVDVFNAREVDFALSSGEVGQALQNLAPSINIPRASASGVSDMVRVIQLRGLAPDQVLVLVNGKRRHTNAVLDQEGLFKGTAPVDLNAIPLSAIDHIEVLRDGAGAQYGSDAVAGVINIVLKGGAQGGSASASYGANHTHFEPTGKTINDGQTGVASADFGLPLLEKGFVRVGADYEHKNGTNRAGPSDAGWTSWNSTPADLALDGKVLFKSGDSSAHNLNLFVNASAPVASNLDAYTFATYNDRSAEGGAFFRYPGDPTNVLAIYPEGYRPVTTGNSTDVSFVAGVKFDIAGWQLDTSVREGDNRFEYGVKNSLNASLDAASPTAFHLANFASRQTSLNVDATHAVIVSGLSSPIDVAIGAEFLHEGYKTEAGDAASYAAGPNTGSPPGAQAGPGLRPEDAVDLSRSVRSVYVDAETEFTKQWLVGAAARYSDYSDFGSASTGKLSSRFKITDSLLMRGSISNSFRAPALAQTGFKFSNLLFNDTGTALLNSALLPASAPLARAFGATKLKAEKSDNLSLGVAWRIEPATSVSVDAYRVKIKDRITRTSDLNSDAAQAYLASIGRTDIASVAFLTNALDTTTQGVDVVLDHSRKLAGGKLQLSAGLNINRTRIDGVKNSSPQLAAIDPNLSLFDSADLLQLEQGTPRNKLVLTSDWSNDMGGVLVRATRFGEVVAKSFDSNAPIVNGSSAQVFGAKWSVDLELQYKPCKTITVAVGGNNIFDQYPDRTYSGSTYGGALPYHFINPIGINGAFYYAKITYKF
jgi:iron complex outermembrane receptor protein